MNQPWENQRMAPCVRDLRTEFEATQHCSVTNSNSKVCIHLNAGSIDEGTLERWDDETLEKWQERVNLEGRCRLLA
jgi:hypothetical protein